MMSLVAYGSSDDDSEAEDESNTVVVASKPTNNGFVSTEEQKEKTTVGPSDAGAETDDINSSGNGDTKLRNETNSQRFINGKQDPETSATSSKDLFSKLPAPSSMIDFIARDSIISRKKSQQKGPVKILVPSLPEFNEDDEPPAKKKLQVQKSSTGTKLMSMLPAPKGGTLIKETKPSLVPQSVTKKPAHPIKPKPPVRKVIPAAFLKSKGSLKSNDDSGDESGAEETSTDFFSLTADHSVPMAEVSSIEKTDIYAQQSMLHPSTTTSLVYNAEQQDSYSGYSSEYPHAGGSSNTFVEPQADSGQDYIGFNSNDLQLDDEAIQKLCGRKGRREENVQIIDVSGDEIMPDSREWLTKQLTQEKPSRSHRKGFGPSSQQRRKHQITYLAFQAKENELELQNQWANNRQSRRQTQSKYGF